MNLVLFYIIYIHSHSLSFPFPLVKQCLVKMPPTRSKWWHFAQALFMRFTVSYTQLSCMLFPSSSTLIYVDYDEIYGNKRPKNIERSLERALGEDQRKKKKKIHLKNPEVLAGTGTLWPSFPIFTRSRYVLSHAVQNIYLLGQWPKFIILKCTIYDLYV